MDSLPFEEAINFNDVFEYQTTESADLIVYDFLF